MPNEFSEFIRAKRGNMSLREFAKLCGNLSHTQIDSIEKGFDPRTSKPVRKISPAILLELFLKAFWKVWQSIIR